ncbi:MAG: nodulation protein NfeD [Candidatus Omnitrophica bacterium]|nr:nodulation protein NfeD [Candidatus Omnitrophota bacterium]
MKRNNPVKLIFCFFTIICGLCLWRVEPQTSAAVNNEVHVIQLDDDTINPVTAEYIVSAIDRAENQGAECLIIKLDTPGGLLTSTRLIVKKIMSAQVPVVVYISPSGSRAGSAGVFITYASHVAAMAPSTNIGAAHPVQMGGQKGRQRDIWDGLKELLEQKAKKEAEETTTEPQVKEEIKKKTEAVEAEDTKEEVVPDEDPMRSKILNDTIAFIKAIAKKRNRNLEWAVKSVVESSSVTETEAQELNVIEIIANNEHELLEKLDGRVVMIDDQKKILNTAGATMRYIEMDARQKFFNILANPNIAYILMILGFYGLMYEVTHPGIGVPGIMGAIFLILAFFSMQTLPTNYAGLALVILGLTLFIAEAFTPTFGLLTLGGFVCMILGSLLLFDSSVPLMRVSLSLILSFTLTTAGITLFLVRAVIRAHRQKKRGGKEGLVGEKGEAYSALTAGEEGKVYVHGELWNAISDENIKKGEKVTVEEVDSMTLKVKRN